MTRQPCEEHRGKGRDNGHASLGHLRREHLQVDG